MGNQLLTETNNIKFVQTLRDPNFGEIDIFRDNSGKFIMKQIRNFIYNPTDIRYQQFKNMLASFEHINQTKSKQMEYIVPILYSKQSVKHNLCVVYETFEIYSEYFNHTLQDILQLKIKLENQEIWMCFVWLLEFIGILEKNKWAIERPLNLQKIFITPRGKICCYSNNLKVEPQFQGQLDAEQISTVKSFPQGQLIEQVAYCIISLILGQTISKESEIPIQFLKRCKNTDIFMVELIERIITVKETKKDINMRSETILQLIERLKGQNNISISKDIKLNRIQSTKTTETDSYNKTQENETTKRQKITPIKIVYRKKSKNNSISKLTHETVRDELREKLSCYSNQIKDNGSYRKSKILANKQNKIWNSHENTNAKKEINFSKEFISSKKCERSLIDVLGPNKNNSLLENSIHLLSTANRRKSHQNKSKNSRKPTRSQFSDITHSFSFNPQ